MLQQFPRLSVIAVCFRHTVDRGPDSLIFLAPLSLLVALFFSTVPDVFRWRQWLPCDQ